MWLLQLDGMARRYGLLPSQALRSADLLDWTAASVALTYEGAIAAQRAAEAGMHR